MPAVRDLEKEIPETFRPRLYAKTLATCHLNRNLIISIFFCFQYKKVGICFHCLTNLFMQINYLFLGVKGHPI